MRYLVVVQSSEAREGFDQRLTARLRNGLPPLRTTTAGRATIATSGATVLEFRGGTIIGPLFGRGDGRPIAVIDPGEARRIVASGGRRLIERYWGGYVAVLEADNGDLSVVRAPFGELPCYWLALTDGLACASDSGLLTQLGLLRPSVAWDAVIRELAWRDFRGTETCLAGLGGLRGGERLTLGDRGSRRDALWSPWQTPVGCEDLDADELGEHVRRAVTTSVLARASQFDHVLLLLSGGLDSSIVAACLATGGTPFSLATMTTRDALGDERDYAETMAEAVAHPLHEALREVARVHPARSTADRLPRPAGRLFDQETVRIAGELACRTGASAIVTGGGGDNVFCSLQSAAPVADRLLTQGPGRGVLDTARDIASVAQVGVSAVLWSALGYLPNGSRSSPVAADLTLLDDRVRDALREVPHAWLTVPPDGSPGTAAHIKLLAAAESFMQGYDPEADLPMLTPLLDQPVVETCLAIPSWRWFSNGLNRVVARRAFAEALPGRIAARRSKGTPDSFAAEIYERCLPVLRERLLGGVLAREGIIDTAAVDRAFTRTGAFAPPEYRRLLRLSEVETWARNWSGRSAPGR